MDTKTMFYQSSFEDDEAFLVNGCLRCLVAHLNLHCETDGNNHSKTSAIKKDTHYVAKMGEKSISWYLHSV